MRNRILKYMFAAVAVTAVSCSREPYGTGDGHGYMTAAVEQDASVTLVTRADVTENDAFILNVYKGSSLVRTINDHRTLLTSPLELNCGTYSVTAENRAEADATFNSPRYYGETQVKVLANQTINAEITCSIADVLVEPSFSDDFAENFKKYSLSVTNGSGTLTWSADDNNLGATGYFKPTGTITWTLSLTNNAGRTFTKSESYDNAAAKNKYALNFKIEKTSDGDGAAGLRIVLDDETNVRSFDLLLDFTSADAEATSANAWALFADITGEFKSSEVPDGFKLQYRKMSDENWTDFTGEITTDLDNKKFTARLTGLDSKTQYVVRAVTSKEAGKKQISFTTEEAASVENMDFDDWYMDGKVPMPNANSSTQIWDTANPGSKMAGVYPTKQETSHLAVTGDGKSAARLESSSAFGVFAAGNIYTGKFGAVSGLGASLEWGVPFTSRPLALKGYLDYTPVAINKTDDDHSSLKGQTDAFQIHVFITDSESKFQINTNTGTFVDFNSSDIIAYGTLVSDETTSSKSGLVNGYEPFTIKLEYRSLTRKPKQVVIVGAASRYGDYFTGGVGSVLYLDEFSFVYDPAEL